MNFEYLRLYFVYVLFLTPVIIFLVLMGLKKREKRILSFLNLQNIKTGVQSSGLRIIPALLSGLMFICLVLTLTQPRTLDKEEESESRGVDIMVVVDVSASMLATDINPSRLVQAKREIIDLVKRLDGDRVGLVAFAGLAFVHCPLTLDYDAFKVFVDQLVPQLVPAPGLDIERAIDVSLAALAASGEEGSEGQAILLMSDGGNTMGDLTAAGTKASKKGVPIYSMGFGSPYGAPIPAQRGGFLKDKNGKTASTKINESPLKSLANDTGGKYVRSNGGDSDIDSLYTSGINVDVKDRNYDKKKRQNYQEYFYYLAAICLMLFLLDFWNSYKPRRLHA